MVKLDPESIEARKELRKRIRNYGNYDKQGERKLTDAAVKEFLKSTLSRLSDDIKKIQEAALMSQMITTWSDLDRLVASFTDIGFLIQYTKYGISTFFDSNVIKEFDLSYLYTLERTILDIIMRLDEKISQFDDAIESGMLSDSSRLTNEILDDLSAIRDAWEERRKLISDFQKLGLV
jgi:gas vesicle protein